MATTRQAPKAGYRNLCKENMEPRELNMDLFIVLTPNMTDYLRRHHRRPSRARRASRSEDNMPESFACAGHVSLVKLRQLPRPVAARRHNTPTLE